MIVISQAHNEMRLAGTLSFLNLGVDVARIWIYDTVRPAFGADPGGDMLVEVPLADPAGAVVDGVLTLEPGAEPLIMKTGIAVWARVVNGNGDIVFDCDVSDEAGTATIKLVDTTLRAGGVVRVLSAALG
jgi:hypothetical protein